MSRYSVGNVSSQSETGLCNIEDTARTTRVRLLCYSHNTDIMKYVLFDDYKTFIKQTIFPVFNSPGRNGPVDSVI